MFPTNFPSFDINLKDVNGQTYIFDSIRKKYLFLTPEEWVRQHLVNLLVNHYAYPKGMFRLEKGHLQNENQKRTDVMVYDGNGEVILLAECKAHTVKLDQKVMEQVMQYNLEHNSPLVLVTNGLRTFCFKNVNGKFEQLREVPGFF